jgi:hypothetical protein
MRYPTDAEMDRLPQVALTADMPWNPYLGDNAAHMHKESEMPNTFNDFIRKLGAMRGLFSNNARAQTSVRVKDILRHYKIDDMQSEANQQNQNYAERRIGEVKRF